MAATLHPDRPMNAPPTKPALEAMRRSIEMAVRVQTARQAMSRDVLGVHLQPIVDLAQGAVFGHECLVRGPEGTALRSPAALFAAARAEGLTFELESHCLRKALQAWGSQQLGSKIFVNLSATALVALVERAGVAATIQALEQGPVAPSSAVVEITEHDQVDDLRRLVEVVDALRCQGLQFALDDFGNGHSNLRLWAELRPEFVKIDKYFVRDAPRDVVKVQTLRGLLRFAETFGSTLVAEGIETADELRVVRDLGVRLGQGFFLGLPQAEAARQPLPAAVAVMASAEIAVFPAAARASGVDFRVERLSRPVEPVAPDCFVDEVARRFDREQALWAVAVVRDGHPLGLIGRQQFVNQYARPFFKEIFGRKPCLQVANTTPLRLDRHTGLEALAEVLTAPDQRYLSEGFIVTEGGRYVGLGSGDQLVRVVTEVRMEAARHANPLTLLPGNIPITQHIARLLASGNDFVAAYADLNDFKPFNDRYGYWQGDEMIVLLARTIVSRCDARRDFVGHVGGDDFIVLFQSEDWQPRCEAIVAGFNAGALELYDQESLARGGIEGEDRHGVPRFFGFTRLSIGALRVRGGEFTRPEQVASAAAMAKHQAKSAALGLVVTGS